MGRSGATTDFTARATPLHLCLDGPMQLRRIHALALIPVIQAQFDSLHVMHPGCITRKLRAMAALIPIRVTRD